MKGCTYDTIEKVNGLLDAATENISTRLATILDDIETSDYINAKAIWIDYRISSPTVTTTPSGTKQLQVYKKMDDMGGEWTDIDNLPVQLRRDMVCQIINQMKINTEDIADL